MPHGFQVGYATHFAMRLQQYAFGGGIQQLAPPCPIAPDGDDARSWLTGHDAEVATVLDEKRQFLGEHAHAWPATQSLWETVQERVGVAMGVFPLVAEALSVAGIPSEPGFLGLDVTTLEATFRWADRIRARYTVLDFLEGQGRLDDAIGAMFFPGPTTS